MARALICASWKPLPTTESRKSFLLSHGPSRTDTSPPTSPVCGLSLPRGRHVQGSSSVRGTPGWSGLRHPFAAGRRVRSIRQAARLIAILERIAGLTVKQKALFEAISARGEAIGRLCREVGVGPAVLRALVAKGLVELLPEPPVEIPTEARGDLVASSQGEPGGPAAPDLWPEQERVVADLTAAYEQIGFVRRLLWGVTGSGKTEVYLRLVARVLQDGGERYPAGTGDSSDSTDDRAGAGPVRKPGGRASQRPGGGAEDEGVSAHSLRRSTRGRGGAVGRLRSCAGPAAHHHRRESRRLLQARGRAPVRRADGSGVAVAARRGPAARGERDSIGGEHAAAPIRGFG